MKVRQVMSEKLITANKTDGIRKTYFTMREKGIRHLPVVDDDKRLLGIISDRDLRRPDWVDEDLDVSHAYRLDDDMQVGDLMSTNVQSVHVYDTLHRATRLFLEHKFGALPVLNKDDALVGIVTPLDLLKALDKLTAPDNASS